MPLPPLTPSLKGRALRALSAREYSRVELQRKLAPHEQTPGELVRVLDELQSKGFLSDARAAESVLNRRAPKFGGARVLQELKQKGLGGQELSQAAAQLKASELERARAVWHKRFGAGAASTSPSNAAEQAKQMRFLASRGFAPELIRQVLRTAPQTLEEGDF
jgi:regulatory protein